MSEVYLASQISSSLQSDIIHAMPPSWMMKLTRVWGEPKNDSKGEDDGFKIEEGGESLLQLFPLLPPLPSRPSTSHNSLFASVGIKDRKG